MESLIACGTSITAKIAEYTVAPFGHQLGYIFHYRRNVDNLKTETHYLKLEKKKMEDLVVEAKRKGDEIHDHIKVWLSEVDDKIIELNKEKYFGDEDTTETKCTLKGSLSYLASWYKLGKKAKEMAESVVKLRGRVNFDHISFRPKLQSHFEIKDYLRSVTREIFVDEMMEVLGDGNVRTIGLHGMPGVGKTTLVKEIARKAIKEDPRLFDDAVIVTVSQTPDHKEIQQKVAERLGLKFDKETLDERALELRHRLKDEKKFLIVLDDVWNELKLEDVGIVFDSDPKGCKILFTSRFERVLGVDMGVDENFEVELLAEDEASNWFNDIVGDVSKTSQFKEIGNKIVKKCGCLPLAIVTVAHSLKKCDDLPLWRDTLMQLERSKHDEIVHSAIKLCYDKLESDEAKKLLLLCTLHGENANIAVEYLMRFGWGQIDMFKNVYTLQQARDRVHRWVNVLKDRCLLLDGDYFGTVKMHDVIHDVAISIAKEIHDMHCFRNGSEVEEFLKEKNFEDLKAISMPNGYLDELVVERSEYAQLPLIICRWKCSEIIPGDFLDRTKQLRVLAFYSQYGYYLPKVLASHLSPLQNLRTLCLFNFDVEDIDEIGKLKNLEILDLSCSTIKKLPGEIGQLTRLRMLDLSGCKYLQVIEPNVILHLKHLEDLYVDSFGNWHKVIDQVDIEERRNAGLDELNHLIHLAALQLYVPDIGMLPEVLLSQKLERYDIQIGGYMYDLSKISDYSRHLYINHTESSLLREHRLEMLMKRSEALWLEGLNGVNNIVSELDAEGFLELKSLRLQSNKTIQYLVNSMGKIHPCSVFGSLEALNLYNLSNLKQICHGEVTVESFKTLRDVRVRNGNSLKKLLPIFNARQVEEIEITNCNAMEEIFTHEIQDDDNSNKEVIVQLRSLKLRYLFKLKEFCSKILLKKTGSSQKAEEPFVGDSVMPLFNGKFLCFPKLENLELSGCNVKKLWDDQLVPSSTSFCCLTKLVVDKCKFLKCVVSSSMAASFKQLYSLEVKGCVAMEEIVSRDERVDMISFPKLFSLKLEDLPRLSTFCSELKTLVSESSEKKSDNIMPSLFNENFVCFPKLERLELRGCDFKKIWDDDQLLPTSTSFRCLSRLEVAHCRFLKYVFSSAMAVHFEQLNYVEVSDCETMEEIMSRSDERLDNMISFPKLQSLVLNNIPNMLSFSKTSEGSSLFDERVAFPSLKSVWIQGMDGLKMIWQYRLCNINADSFCKLGKLRVASCENLMGIFPSGMHTRLGNLRRLEISKCEMVEEIFEMETSNSEEISTQLESIYLDHLSNLKYVWSKDPHGTFMFPMLQEVMAFGCGNLKSVFPPSIAKHLSRLIKLDIKKCGIEEVVGKQEGLETVLPDHDDEFVFPQLQIMELESLPNLVSFYAGTHTLRFPLLKKLEVIGCSEFLSFQGRHESLLSTKVTFGRDVKCIVKLCELPNLMHLMEEEEKKEESSQQKPQILTKLELVRCKVKKLGPSSISFRHLNSLIVRDCHGMLHLLSSQTAESMTQLSELTIEKCRRMEEIISDAGVDSKGGEIVFTRLEYLALDDLPRLASFYSGNYTMRFPNLKCLGVDGCFEMQSFSKHGIISTPKLIEILIDDIDYGESKWAWGSESKSESETESSSNCMVDINSIIAKHWMSAGTALQELFTEKGINSSFSKF